MNLSGNVLVVDDERTTRMVLCEALRQTGKTARAAASAVEALAALKEERFDVVLLDLQMPHKGGLAVLDEADELAPQTAFVIFTAHASADTAIIALRSGVFDYLLKPAPLDEILAVVDKALAKQAEQRRQQEALQLLERAMAALTTVPSAPAPTEPPPGSLTAGQITIDLQRQSVAYKGKPLRLTPIEYKLLCEFARQPNAILSYADLVFATHQTRMSEDDARLLARTHLFRLSRKLGGKDESPLRNIHSRGYILHT
jgi:DNA-binding response OmpR family regulator